MDPTDPLVVRLEELAAQVARLEERVARLEPAPRRSVTPPTVVETARPGPVRFDVTLVGRSLIVLGGGYLLRAITEVRVVPQVVGVAGALALAVALVALADRAAVRGRMASSWFHGATALVIAYPLIGETVIRFGLMGPAAGALLIAAFGASTLIVAQRRRDVGLAWIAMITMSARLARKRADRFGLQVLSPPIEIRPYSIVQVWRPRVDADPGHVWFRRVVARAARL